MRQFKPRNKRMQDCIAKLGSILETYGQDTFCDAVQNLLDNHPDTQSWTITATKLLCYQLITTLKQF